MKDKLKDKMKKKFTDLSISHKMLMVYITFASAFLLIALGLTQISFRIYSKELYDKSLQELDYFSQNVNRGLKDAERNNYSISMDALVQRTLSDLSVLEYPSLDYNQKIRDLRRILLNEYDPESCVKSIIFVDLYGNTVEVGTAAWDVSGESFTAIKKQMEQGKGAYTTYGPTEECPYLLSGRVVRNRLDMSLSDMGKLIFVCDVGNVISENKESLSSNKAAIYVYNKNCAIYEDENIKKLDDLPKYVEHSGYKILKQSGRKYFVSYLYSAKTDWTYVSFFPYSDIYGQVQTVRTLLILGFLAVFTALVFFMKKLSVVIVSPLEHLTDSMQIVENGDFQGAREMLTNTDRQDEIGTLSREFRTMLETVDTLIHENYEKQLLLKDTKYKMLRAQINPHFLYNTLNVIHWMIRAKRNEEAGRMIVELASAASLEGDISVAHELYKQLLYLFTMVDNKTDAGLLCYPTQNEAESNTYYFDFDRLKSSDRYDNILFEITLAMKKLQSIGLSNDEKQRIFEAFIVTWSSYVGSEKLKLLNIGGINSDESAITEVSRWIAETLNIYETGKEKERMEKILDVIYSNFDNTELNIQYIAKNILFMNEDYFGRVFIRNMHLKFSAYLEQSRIEMAKRLLEYNPDMRIAMLTELIGYPADGQYFSKTFRKVCGMTPTEYRENLKKTDI